MIRPNPLEAPSHPPALARPRALTALLWALAALGVAAFAAGALGERAERAWQAYLVNFLFWSGLSLAGPVFAAILETAKARWAVALRRLAVAGAAFLPASLVLFAVLFFGRQHLFAASLSSGSAVVFARDGFALALLYGAAIAFAYQSLRADAGRGRSRLAVLAPIVIVLYALGFSLVGFDFVMFLDPEWPSTLFGAYFCVGNLYLGLAFLGLVAASSRPRSILAEDLGGKELHDLGKLLFAFCLLWMYLFWSQYLPIWYGDLPEETRFVLARIREEPWRTVSVAILVLEFVVPFVALLSRRVKTSPFGLGLVSGSIVIGIWLERFVLVVPSVWRGPTLPLGATEILITAGFLAGYALAFLSLARAFPPAGLPSRGEGDLDQ